MSEESAKYGISKPDIKTIKIDIKTYLRLNAYGVCGDSKDKVLTKILNLCDEYQKVKDNIEPLREIIQVTGLIDAIVSTGGTVHIGKPHRGKLVEWRFKSS